MKRIRVLVVDDSVICRESLKAILEADGDIEVIGEGEDGFSALGLVASLAPDLVTMDVQMPGKSGLETVEQIMARNPVPIIVVTAEPLSDQTGVAFTAIENGALDVVAKPSFEDDEAGAALRALVRSFARVPVFKRVSEPARTSFPAGAGDVELIALTAGRGGISSVLALLSKLPVKLRCPVVLYEPVPAALVPSYTKHLAKTCKLPVTVGLPPGAKCAPGELLFVPALGAEWTVKSEVRLEAGGYSANHFFSTLAKVYGRGAVGIVLAGSGNDGAEGLLAIKNAGGQTLAESPTRDVISEMPVTAIECGAADTACSVDHMIMHLMHTLAAL